MKLWLDDIREPWKHGFIGVHWATTADEAIEYLKTGRITFASLDHDLAPEHYCPADKLKLAACSEKTGYDVICWMEENDVWPENGVRVHSMNPVGKARMEAVVRKHYGRNWR